MGYTNYWTPKKLSMSDIPEQFWEDAREVLDIVISRGVILATGSGETKLLSGKDILSISNPDGAEAPAIIFNGWTGNETDYETFELIFDGVWSFCKTARLPYDIAVKCILILAERYDLLDITGDDKEEWSFDGDKDEEEYLNAMEIITALDLDKSTRNK